MALRVLISAGETSGDLYAATLVETLRRRYPNIDCFGCAGPRMREAGVRPVVRAESLSVVGLFEVLAHIPRIYGEFRKLLASSRAERPHLAILTDSPDFHLRLARKLKRSGIPTAYLVAPQAWAWRPGRTKILRETIDHLFCIFPFEEAFFSGRGVRVAYVGHPLTRLIRARQSKREFFAQHGIPLDRPLIAVLPGSRAGEAARHLEPLAQAAEELRAERPVTFVAGAPAGFSKSLNGLSFWERFDRASIQVIEGSTWDLLAHADLALAASGTVTIEAALLGTPMVTFYRVSPLSWVLGRRLVRVSFLSMVNLIAERALVPELMQRDMTGRRLAAEARRLLDDTVARTRMIAGLDEVRARLTTPADPMERTADILESIITRSSFREKDTANVR